MQGDDWVRTRVWLVLGNGHRIQVQARKLCRLGGFLEYTGPVWDRLLEIVFPQPDASEGGAPTRWWRANARMGSGSVSPGSCPSRP